MSEGDVWSIQQTPGAGNTGAAFAGPGYPVMPRRPWERGDWAWVTAGALLLLAAVAQTSVLFADGRRLTMVDPVYYYIDADAAYGVRVAIMLAIGALLVLRRAREVVGGLAVGSGLAFALGHFYTVRPVVLKKSFAGWLGEWLTVGVYTSMIAATVIVLVLLLRKRGRVGERQSMAERKVDRIVAVVLGFTGGVFWLVSAAMAWLQIGVGSLSGAVGKGSPCCSWSQDDGWKQVGILVAGVTITILALVAATLRSRARAAGLLLGLVLATLPDVASDVVQQIAPTAGLFGLHYSRILPAGIRVIITAATGFWMALVALLLLSAAAVSRVALGPRKAAYPQNDLERIAS